MGDLHALLETSLGPLYRVEREVRPVGECRLFIAEELAPPGAELVVKVLPATLSLAVDPVVFERELVLTADRLSGMKLVMPRTAGRAGSWVYHTRRFVEGTTLRAWINRNGELPLRQAVEILRDILTDLAAVHAAKLVHGDLKPEQVLIGNGRNLTADPGVVDAVERSLQGAARGAATAAICAPPYLAPERRDRDAPSGHNGPPADMFAVGVILHEMLTGRTPAPESEPLEEVRSLPPWLATLVRRCLAAEPEDRWEDAGAALATMPHRSGGLQRDGGDGTGGASSRPSH
ncbi:MAG TPA: protein kinase [Gemmatimonadales bacterium]|nr:protein kinase [Gemmatimonadales bacterium]